MITNNENIKRTAEVKQMNHPSDLDNNRILYHFKYLN